MNTNEKLTISELVAAGREATRALRAIARNGGRTAATTGAVAARDADLERILMSLDAQGRRDLSGDILDEHKVAVRLTEARQAGQQRPELFARQQATQKRLRAAERQVQA